MGLTKISTDGVKDDAVTTDKLANAINTERTANTAKVSTTINNNADNRVITGSGTANTLNGEAGLTWNGSRLDIDTSGVEDCLRIGTSAGTDTAIRLGSTGTDADTHAVIKYDKDDNWLSMLVSGESHGAGGILIANGGNVGIGTTSPADKFHVVAGSQRNFVVRSTGGEPHLYAQNDSGNVENLMIGGNNVIFKAGSGSTGNEIARISENGGITFNGDTAAANALDDYEEGTWTMTAQSGADSIGQSAANQRYTKIGNVVTVVGEVSGLTNANGSTLNIAGLPYNVAQGREGTGSCFTNNVTFPSGYSGPTMYCWADTDRLRVYVSTSGGGWHPLTGTQVGSGSFIFTATYLTS